MNQSRIMTLLQDMIGTTGWPLSKLSDGQGEYIRPWCSIRNDLIGLLDSGCDSILGTTQIITFTSPLRLLIKFLKSTRTWEGWDRYRPVWSTPRRYVERKRKLWEERLPTVWRNIDDLSNDVAGAPSLQKPLSLNLRLSASFIAYYSSY